MVSKPIVQGHPFVCLNWADISLLGWYFLTPIWCCSDQNWSAKRYLVIPSTTLSVVDIFLRPSFPEMTKSWTKWYQMSMCFEAFWWSGLVDKAVAPFTVVVNHWNRIGVGSPEHASMPIDQDIGPLLSRRMRLRIRPRLLMWSCTLKVSTSMKLLQCQIWISSRWSTFGYPSNWQSPSQCSQQCLSSCLDRIGCHSLLCPSDIWTHA